MQRLRIAVSFAAVWLSALMPLAFAESNLVSVRPVTPFVRAVLNGDVQATKEELSRGADPNQREYNGRAALHEAMSSRSEIAKALLEAHADANIRVNGFDRDPTNGWTPIFFAINSGRTDLVKLLIKYGANVNITDAQNKPPLSYAIARQRNEIVALLLKAGARPPSQSLSRIPQPTATYSSEALVQPDAADMQLSQAILLHDRDKVKSSLEHGADPNKPNHAGYTPLHEAMKCDVEICRLLLDHGADPNIPVKNLRGFSNNWTPIFFAAYYGRDDLISELLRHGAEVKVVDAMGKSPLWYARDQKKEAAVKVLEAAGASG